MHFLPCFDVIVLSVHGRFQIKLWKVLAFKLVISGDYLAAVELTFFIFFSGPQTGLCDCALQRQYQMPIVDMLQQWAPLLQTDLCWLGLGRETCKGFQQLYNAVPWSRKLEKNKMHSLNAKQRDRCVLRLNTLTLCGFTVCELGVLILLIDWADLK